MLHERIRTSALTRRRMVEELRHLRAVDKTQRQTIATMRERISADVLARADIVRLHAIELGELGERVSKLEADAATDAELIATLAALCGLGGDRS